MKTGRPLPSRPRGLGEHLSSPVGPRAHPRLKTVLVHIMRHRTPVVAEKLLKIIERSSKKNLRVFQTESAYPPYAPCLATPLLEKVY